MFYKALLRPWLFQSDPEDAHERALDLAASLGRCRIARDAVETMFVFEDPRLRQTVFGIEFANPTVGRTTPSRRASPGSAARSWHRRHNRP